MDAVARGLTVSVVNIFQVDDEDAAENIVSGRMTGGNHVAQQRKRYPPCTWQKNGSRRGKTKAFCET